MRIFHFQQAKRFGSGHMKKLMLFIAVFCFSGGLLAQTETVVRDTVHDFERLDPVMVSGSMDEAKIKEYQILKRRVIKTMPFACGGIFLAGVWYILGPRFKIGIRPRCRLSN